MRSFINWKLWIGVVIYLISVAIYGFIMRSNFRPDEAGQFGDMFGCFTAFVTGLALFGVAYSISLQNSAHVVSSLDVLHRRFNERHLLVARHRSCERLLGDDPEGKYFSQSMQYVAEYFEHMGVVVKLQAIEAAVIWNLYSWHIEHYWAHFGNWIKEARRDAKDDSGYTEFEWLYGEMLKISKKRGIKPFERTQQELASFLNSEKKLTERLLGRNREEALEKGQSSN